jgi:hypothetical protein
LRFSFFSDQLIKQSARNNMNRKFVDILVRKRS